MVVTDASPFTGRATQRPQPRYGAMAPTRSYVHLKITFSTNDRAIRAEFAKKFEAFVNECIEQHLLPINEYQTALLTPTRSGFNPKRSVVKTEVMLTSHLTDQQFREFTAAARAVLEGMSSVVEIDCKNHHHHALIAATGIESD